MHNNKVYTILQHFDKNDFKQFNRYINSPYFNKSKLLIQYFDLLEKHIHSKNADEFPKEKFWKKLFSPLKYNDVRFRKLSSDLLRIVEGFLAQQVYDRNSLQKNANLLKILGEKGIKKLYNSVMKVAQIDSDKFVFEDADFYLAQYQIQKNYYEINQHEFKHSERQNLEEIDENLNIFYFSEKLRYYCTVLSQKERGVHKYNLSYIEEILKLIPINKNTPPSISIYYQIYLTYIEEENEENYYKLKLLLKEHGSKFQSIEAKTLYDSTINFCVKKLNQGNTHFLNEIFEIYEDYILKESIYIDGELDPFHFKNIVIVALRLGKFEWTETFILNSKERLPEKSKENAVTFNLARLYYYQKQYDKVISLLQEVEYEDLVYNLSTKSLLLATYYENDEVEALYSLLESFRAFLNRRKDLTERKKRNYLNTIKFTKRLTKIIPGDSKAIEKLRQDINKTSDISDLTWLKEKIAELE